MTKILFVCHGNICRSPMAEFVMKHLVQKAGREDEFFIRQFRLDFWIYLSGIRFWILYLVYNREKR